MLIYLYGPDSYRRGEKLKEIVTKYKDKHTGINIRHFDLVEKGTEDILSEFIADRSLFSTAKLGVVHIGEKKNDVAKLLKSVLDDKHTTLIITSDKKLTTGYPFLHKKPTLSQEFKALKATELYTFIKTEAKSRGVTMTPAILSALAETFGSDTWALVTELEKIALGGTVEEKTTIPDFFPLVQRLGRGSLSSRLSALTYLLETGDAAATFNITAAIAHKELKIKMADLDVAIKSGRLEYPEALTSVALDASMQSL